MKKSKKNMHRADIIAAIRKQGTTLTQLSVDAGLHPRTLANALDRKYPKGEKIISDCINVPVQERWPERYL